jgi:hypothetical protein
MRLLKRQTVRPQSSVRIRVLVCALLFAAAAIVISRWGRERWIPVNRQTTYTATARAVEALTGAATPFTTTDVNPAQAKAHAGILAERYAADRVAEWRRGKESSYQKSHDFAEKARQECDKNAASLTSFEQQRREGPSLPVASPKPIAPPPMIDNPAWLDLQRQVADLEGRRDQLLIDRTPQHPAVQEIEGSLAQVKQQLAATARQILDTRVKNPATADAAAIASPPVDDLAAKEYERKRGELTAAIEKSRLACQEADRAEKQAGQELAAVPQFVFEQSEPIQNLPQADYGWRRLLWTTFASSLLMVFGIATVWLGAGIDPPVVSVEDVEGDLNETVLGVLPFNGPAPDMAAIERQVRLRRAAIACGTILILGCPVVAIWGVLGI